VNCAHSGKGRLVGLIELAEADVEGVLRGGFHHVAVDSGWDEVADYRGAWLSICIIASTNDEVEAVTVKRLAVDFDWVGGFHGGAGWLEKLERLFGRPLADCGLLRRDIPCGVGGDAGDRPAGGGFGSARGGEAEVMVGRGPFAAGFAGAEVALAQLHPVVVVPDEEAECGGIDPDLAGSGVGWGGVADRGPGELIDGAVWVLGENLPVGVVDRDASGGELLGGWHFAGDRAELRDDLGGHVAGFCFRGIHPPRGEALWSAPPGLG